MIRQKIFIPHPSNKWELVRCHYQVMRLRIRLRFFCGPKSNGVTTTFQVMFGLLTTWRPGWSVLKVEEFELISLLELEADPSPSDKMPP